MRDEMDKEGHRRGRRTREGVGEGSYGQGIRWTRDEMGNDKFFNSLPSSIHG